MQARIATIKPELDELSKKYNCDPMNRDYLAEKSKLFKKAGIKHSHQMAAACCSSLRCRS